MKKLLPFILVGMLLGCRDEKDVDPANSPTFMRYFGSEHDHTAVLAVEADNGYSMLSNVDIPVDNLGDFNYKIRFFHTDLNGNSQWDAEFPAFGTPESDLDGYRASSFMTLDDGYLIIGERINKAVGQQLPKTKLFLLKIDFSGNEVWSDTISTKSGNLHGRAVTKDADGNFLILGSITDGASSIDMYIAEIDESDHSVNWSREYGSADMALVNRLYVNNSQNLVWGGSVSNLTSSSDVRLLVASENSNANVENLVGDPARKENALDFCETLGGFAFVGSAIGDNGSEDIYFTKVNSDGKKITGPDVPFDFDGLNDKAVSVCPGLNGGYMILATVESGPNRGNGRADFLLYEVDDFGRGEVNGGINYGGSDTEEGASIRTTSDGSYLVFGTTTFGNLKKLMLMKVDDKGRL